MPNLNGPESRFCKASALPKGGPASNRRNQRRNPPADSCAGDPQQWVWRAQSPIYRRRIKRAIEAAKRLRQTTRGVSHLTRGDKDAIHRLLDTATRETARG